ncbi:Hpt domain-containing protein [Pseudotamlana agarivorans]|uniref:Hpt domain-containing protein n=1 Tax=Pseudotamlana agarivorans TaxID=481183 RepID=UPI00082E1F22|nr:Hpt domain-containing protein [Tamlana agarivorans]
MVDLSFLEKFTKGDAKKMKRYISLYLDVAPKTFEEMQRNVDDRDWEQLRINAHSLKPQTDFMGITSLKDVLVKIEEAVKEKKLDDINKYFSQAKGISINSINSLKDVLIDLT